jgi:hypothetical protein
MSTLTFRSITGAAVRADGHVVLSDHQNRRVIVLDSTLALVTTVFDANSPAPLTYPRTPPTVLRGQNDTVYVSDPQANAMRVIAPDNRIVRREMFKDREDAGRIGNRFSGAQMGSGVMYFTAPLVPRVPGQFSAEPHDSAYLVRVNLVTSRRDTFGIVALKVFTKQVPADSVSGELRGVVSIFPPFESGDAIALTPRGELAVIRGSDFHVDWLSPNGTWRRSEPVQWPWHKLTPAERDTVVARGKTWFRSGNLFTVTQLGQPRPRNERELGRLPDYLPAFAPMSAIADHQGMVWLQVGARSPWSARGAEAPTFAGIDSTGQIKRLIRLPAQRLLIGFDRAGRAYATSPGPDVKVEVFRP